MSNQSPQDDGSKGNELPIERGFPIERVNEIAEKEGRAKQHYRPTYTMHKWWARRLGCVFRAISLYTLVDKGENVTVTEPGEENTNLSDFSVDEYNVDSLIDRVDLTDPDALWELYPKDVTVENKRVLDPFMGGGTSLGEASRFGAEVIGNDLNPVAWFITKKEMEAHNVDADDLTEAFRSVKSEVGTELSEYYQTSCPNNSNHTADVMYYFWVKELDCVSCGSSVPLFNDYRVGKGRYENKGKYNVFCPECESVILVEDWQSECTCSECYHSFTPKEGNVDGGYICQDCGQKYGIVDAIQEQDGYDTKLYALEYYCEDCEEDESCAKHEVKGYKSTNQDDQTRYQEAVSEWESSSELEDYVPQEEIPIGVMTDSTQFDKSIGGGHNLLRHGYEYWTDFYNPRQLLCLSKLLRAIDDVENEQAKEYLLLAFTESLNYTNNMVIYQSSNNKAINLFKSNSFDPPVKPVEVNVWGAEYGAGNFQAMWDMVVKGVQYARNPTERYIENGETKETNQFNTPLGENVEIYRGDARELNFEKKFDAVITDPPYYNNIIYSEVSNYFYVWMKLLLEDKYEGFDSSTTPRAESIVANPAEGKGDKEFESEIRQAFNNIINQLKDDGILTFTYHHSSSESWGELLEALCDVGFEVSATYPITADIQKFTKGEAVTFDIIVVARPAGERESVSWNSLRREIYRTAQLTQRQLEQNRDLSRGDIGVIEMGECFREYSKHHGKVQREGEIMSAKEVVQEIYGIIQEASDIGVEDVFIDLLDTSNPSYDDVNKLCRGTNATPEELKEMSLYNQDDGFELGTWDNEKRQAYIQERTNGDSDEHLSNLDKLQFLRYRFEKGKAVQNYVDKWGVDDDLRELAGRLADVTGDDTYTRVLGDRDITSY